MGSFAARPGYFAQQAGAVDPYLKRSPALAAPFVIPLLIAGISWSSGGVPQLTDMSFICLAALCIVMLVMEFVRFPRRFGIGAMVIFGGFLSWICIDYFSNWYGRDFTLDPPFPAVVIAKSAFFHMLFMVSALIGVNLKPGRWLVRTLKVIPEPNSDSLYIGLILVVFAIGICPYFFFTREPFYLSIYHGILAGRGEGGTSWTVGASGRINYNWGAYVAQLTNIGAVGGQLAVFYAILICRRPGIKLMCWLIWLLWLALAFGTGTRGQVAFMLLPVIALFFLKYQSWAAMLLQKISLRAYLYSGILLALMYILVQIQGEYRTLGYRDVQFSKINVMELHGNSMFSEGLPGWAVVPDKVMFFGNRFPGEGLIRPMPETAFWFVVKIIPRALWTSKPLDPMEEWYGDLATHGQFYATVSTGLIGEWYFRYGWLGVLQGGILFGFLARCAERAVQEAEGSPMTILVSMGLATWLYRTFRNFMFHDLYPVIVGAAALYVVVKIFNALSPRRAPLSPARSFRS